MKTSQHIKDYYKKWYAARPGYQSRSAKKHLQKVKSAIIAAYGGKCQCCGDSQPIFLSIDHIHNDGHLDKYANGWRYLGAALYSRILKEGCPKDRYQLLCWNCNCGKRVNQGICPHKENENV
jgi:hypothetical protein